MKSFLPWLFVLLLLGGVVFLFSANRKQALEVAGLHAESTQAEALRAELEQLKTNGSPAQAEQIAQLQKDKQELLKLRNEVRQLRDDKKQISQQAQTAQAQAQAAQSQILTLSTNLQAAQAASAQQALAARYGLPQGTVEQQSLNACINQLRQLDGAKQQWALENKKTANDTPNERDIAVYLKGGAFPKCPAGGVYAINTVALVPTCSIRGHALPQ